MTRNVHHTQRIIKFDNNDLKNKELKNNISSNNNNNNSDRNMSSDQTFTEEKWQ